MKTQIKIMLADAYSRLGVKSVWDIDHRVTEALDYLEKDRERYIEAAEPDIPEFMITTKHGVICHLIPLGRQITADTVKEYVYEHTAVLSLMVTEDTVRYVISYSNAKLYNRPQKNTYTYPTYRHTRLEDIKEDFQVLSPQEITPVATSQEREIYGMVFTAIAKFSDHLPINCIPHKAERAMMAVEKTVPGELIVDGQPVTGKLIPLAQQESLWEEMREDHRYSYRKELCILVTEGTPKYLLKTHHIKNYFRKRIIDDASGDCIYEPTHTKREITYQFVELSDMREKFYALYD